MSVARVIALRDREARATAPRDGPAKIVAADPALEATPHASELPAYAELHCLSNFTFLRGASKAKELFARAVKLGYEALAITDECSLAGIVRAYEAAQKYALKLIVGAEFALADGPRFVLLAADQAGYTALCGLITVGRRAAKKGEYVLCTRDVAAMAREGLLAIALARRSDVSRDATVATHVAPTRADLEWLRDLFPRRTWLAVELHRGARDLRKLEALRALAAQTGAPLVACGDVHMHARSRRALQDALTAIRLNTTIAQAGLALFPNGERHLRSREILAKLYPRELLEESARIAARCTFDLGQLRYEYPRELVPPGRTAAQHLRALTQAGIAWRWPNGIAPKVRDQIEHELALIAELKYESYFLTVHDIVRFARAQGILCQGRGSAANSAVCFALGVTEVDPSRMNMLFERFISKERNEPPDIDIDFEHERREEVIQYIYAKYGRDRAALAATVISYRGKSTIRDLGKALGLDLDQVEQLSGCLQWWDGLEEVGSRLAERGFDPSAPVIQRLLVLASQLVGFPRHLSQHVGGFVISEHALSTLVPVENATMPDRTVIQWDKDDLDTLGLLKVDCLALGMLTCIRKCFDLVHGYKSAEIGNRKSEIGKAETGSLPRPALAIPDSRFAIPESKLTLATIPAEDPQTYAMIQKADTVGVFQIESRAQMSMLPRLKPANFYDLVIEVAIVRPGPIQGKMVHPFLRRRQGLEPVDYPSEALREVFGRTLGVPIFQEQVMQVAIVAAGFTPGEADQLRRSMAAWSRRGGLEHFQRRILDGMAARGYTAEFANQIFEQIKGFASYGFPESHAASFALLVYASCWLKCHEPAAFACALLNSQPMGFYAPGQILQDAKSHGVQVRPPCVLASAWDSSLEPFARTGQPAIRLGLREIRGLSEDCAQRIVSVRRTAPLRDLEDLVARASLDKAEREKLAAAGALRALAGHRRRAYWAIAAVEQPTPLLENTRIADDRITLAPEPPGDAVRTDYATLGYTLGVHPLKLLRKQLAARRAKLAREVKALPPGSRVRAVGLVNLRQRPSTASGTTFITLEDESGWLNVIVWQRVSERQRRVLLESQLLAIDGVFESADGVSHVIAHELHDWSALLEGLDSRSRDFH